MLVIPIIGKISRKNPPYVTIALILINVLVYFLFQLNDDQKYYKALEYYWDSDLAAIELLYYQAYSDANKILPIADVPREVDLKGIKDAKEEEIERLYHLMSEDEDFSYLLEKNKIILPDDELYSQWHILNQAYQKDLNKTMIYRFGNRPSDPKWYTFITSMFLHGGFGHLFGNMVFLWLVGCFLEMGCGRLFYLALYFLSGIAADVAFMLVYPHSTVPCVGASGAIAGMMGAFAVLFGRKRVKIFFSLGFYFGYRQMTGIFLLPLWLFNEIFQLFFSGVPQVAYVAHIGGIVAGAALAQINLKKIGAYDEKAIASDDEPVDEISPMIEKALEHIGKMEFEAGRAVLEQALLKDPSNVPVMTHLFNTLKNTPDDKRFHTLTKDLIGVLITKPATQRTALKVFNDYETIVGRLPKLSPETYVRIGVLFAHDAQPEASSRILTAIMRQKPNLPSIPPAILKLADSYKKAGQIKESNHCLQMIIEKFPGSRESQMAKLQTSST